MVLGDAYDAVAGAADHAAGSTDEAFGRWHSQSREIANSDWSPTQRLTGYARITTRHGLGPIGEEAEDLAFENEAGSFMGNEDETDLAGPSVGGSSEAGEGGLSIDWRDPRAEDNDPTHPSNNRLIDLLVNHTDKVILAVVGLYVLTALGPLLEMIANATEA